MSSMRLVREPMPVLSAGQVLVEVKTVGLNFADVFCALGLYKAAPKGDFVPGLEFAGVVAAQAAEPGGDGGGGGGEAAGEQGRLRPGDRVLGVLRFGAFASHVAVDAAYLRRVPAGWSFEQAAAYPVQTLTAAYGLWRCGGYSPGGAVLVHSAAGGVGMQALRICERCGSPVLGLVGSEAKADVLRRLFGGGGGGEPGRQQRPHVEFAARVAGGGRAAAEAQLSGYLQRAGLEGFDVVLDSYGGSDYFQAGYSALNPCGRLVVFGAGAMMPKPGRRISLSLADVLAAPASLWAVARLAVGWLRRPRLDVLDMPGDNKGVLGFNLIWLYQRLDLITDLYRRLEDLRLDPPMVGRTFAFEELPAALAFLQSGESVGKVVCTVDGGGGGGAVECGAVEG